MVISKPDQLEEPSVYSQVLSVLSTPTMKKLKYI